MIVQVPLPDCGTHNPVAAQTQFAPVASAVVQSGPSVAPHGSKQYEWTASPELTVAFMHSSVAGQSAVVEQVWKQ